ncbi:MAG TPA: sugar transferase [Chloroflexota bacterium]|nr:sugar transferase [Chloroflexota bacterium]HUM68377.1 sugar transferase [Chloroflexota bacterium]
MTTFSTDDTSQRDQELTYPEHALSSLLLSVYPQTIEMSWWQQCRPEKRLLRGKSYLKAKRIMDLALIFSTLVFVLPLLLFCALLIKIESPGGPVLFKQKRTGMGGYPFYMFKFRTMTPNAEEMKKDLAHLNELRWPDFKITNDPRITRMGRILRKTSLDEMPQLLNVLRGEMSLVGPRPTSFLPETYELWQTERLDVLPGITGLWQILGRGSMEFDERVRLDVAYIERRCLWLDIQILLRTFTVVLGQRGAY